jgi:membrane-associated phospholipid phosphatase
VAFPVICVLTAVWAKLPRIVVAALVLNLLGVVFAIVYTGEHYLVDALAGALYGVVAWLLVRRLLERGSRPERTAHEGRVALVGPETGR